MDLQSIIQAIMQAHSINSGAPGAPPMVAAALAQPQLEMGITNQGYYFYDPRQPDKVLGSGFQTQDQANLAMQQYMQALKQGAPMTPQVSGRGALDAAGMSDLATSPSAYQQRGVITGK